MTSPTLISPIAALREYLLSDADVAEKAEARLFVPELPPNEAAHMPRTCVVLSYSGGPPGIGASDYAPVAVNRIDVRCYGGPVISGGWFEVEELWRAVYLALKGLQPQQVDDGYLYHAIKEAGPNHQRDSDTDWPLIFSSWAVMSGEAS